MNHTLLITVHFRTSALLFLSVVCLSSSVTFTLLSHMRAIQLTAQCVKSSLFWCGDFHYAGQLELLGNAHEVREEKQKLKGHASLFF